MAQSSNNGRPYTRNTGITIAEGDSIIFLDQDMIVSPNFTMNFAIRQAFTDNCVFIGFREGIDKGEYGESPQRRPELNKDWRIKTVGEEKFINLSLQEQSVQPEMRRYKILEESNDFKNFGYGKRIGWWDLTCMVISHSLSCKTSTAKDCGELKI